MTKDEPGRPVVRRGVAGHMVRVKTSERFVPNHYPGKDPRTVAKKEGRDRK